MFYSLSLFSQKETLEIIDAKSVEGIQIYADEVYSISIETYEGSEIIIATHSEGEYYNRIRLNTEIQDENLILSTQYPEALSGGYDKLSAHKVFSLDLELKIPERLKLYIESNLASVTATGEFEFLELRLNQGFCDLRDFSGNGNVQTIMGNILVETLNTRVKAESRNGNLEMPLARNGDNLLKLTSVNGDIRLRKTK
ncbi:DUF4097 family beta strand repeat-containing protein [Salegentibacter flavus]|uniref:Adhesin domain-containing protein n=1 Tax=Salegentibacter flavus TaxID=287099 RepID=A0A1I5CYS6_9FLAO|nr:hypothetical protein [Salegentibacter flavus]SFN92047.1 hypothetical protein SAMN05660413_03083 [Salegentibacter flavus]